MKSTFKILFYLKRNAPRKNGNVPIIGRITVDGKIAQISTKLEIHPGNWNTKSGKAVGRTAEIQQINTLLEAIKVSIHKIYHEQQRRDGNVTAEKIKNEFLGVAETRHNLLELFQRHNEDVKKLIGIDKSKATYQKYEVTRTRLTDFIKEKYNLSDIALKEINHLFLTDFEVYLRTTCGCNSNTTAKFMQFFKRIIILAKNNGWIVADPFVNYKIHFAKVDRGYLTQEEIEVIMNKQFATKRLEQVRDIFVFSCFTGLAYIDAKNLRENNIRTSFDGGLWIMGKREKTGVNFNIPLLEVPKMILDKYKGSLPNNIVLPVLSNQKMNAYLKEIGDLCGIEKELTFHLARHSFATLTLSKGVSIESVSKMLGHTNIKTTQIYARITDAKISHDMAAFAGKMKGVETKLAVNP
ncbi:Tyrosine recombinase XerD [termite gut metagenome]|uniref:Tyrosine recombinase XerD n=2 Tax=termite gut metagenome TaxID=433724 RepID=A0A5J4RYE0_9ZZZZ